MDVDWNAELIDQIDAHWRGRLRPRLAGISDDEYFWQPVAGCWTLSRRGESTAPISFGGGEFTMDYAEPPHDPEPVTTIAWRMAHLIGGLASSDGIDTYCYAGTADEALQQLDDEYATWLDGVRSLGIAGLSAPQGEPPAFAHAPMAKKILYTNVELIHHGAEICLLRDLYLRLGPAQ